MSNPRPNVVDWNVAHIMLEKQIGSDQSVTFANSDAANTQKTIDITSPDKGCEEYALIAYNPSTVTDLTVKVFAKSESLGGADRYSLITTVSIPKSQTLTGTTVESHVRHIHGLFNGADLHLVVSNDTVLGASDGFTATVRLREVM